MLEPKRVRKESEECAPESEKSPKRQLRTLFGLFRTPGRTLRGLWGAPGPEAPGRTLRTLFGLFWCSGPEGLGRGVPKDRGSWTILGAALGGPLNRLDAILSLRHRWPSTRVKRPLPRKLRRKSLIRGQQTRKKSQT